ncbi:MAG: hypothetical protein ACI9VO_001511, partial [Colwellia sp.]
SCSSSFTVGHCQVEITVSVRKTQSTVRRKT